MELNSTEERLTRELKPFKPVIKALDEAINKHPKWPVFNMYKQACILGEEAGEVMKAVLKFEDEDGSIDEIKEELHQTAAMCMRMLKHLYKSANYIDECKREKVPLKQFCFAEYVEPASTPKKAYNSMIVEVENPLKNEVICASSGVSVITKTNAFHIEENENGEFVLKCKNPPVWQSFHSNEETKIIFK